MNYIGWLKPNDSSRYSVSFEGKPVLRNSWK